MNYKPFSVLAVGALFRDLDAPALLLMKTSQAEQAVVIEGAWFDNKLYHRGMLMPIPHNECVDALEAGVDAPLLPVQRVDPIDPRRKFWREGETRAVGRDKAATINVFAGLFLYSGLGMGNYFSARSNEVFWVDGTKAREMAAEEGVPYVYFDTMQWTSDPTLTEERRRAQAAFDTARAACTQA